MSNPNVPFSRLKEQRSRKRCPCKQILAQDLWPSKRLQGIRPSSIKLQGIRPHGAKLPSTSNLSRDLFLSIRMANPRLTNQGTSWRSCKRWRMINSIARCLFGYRAWYNGWIIRWSPVNNQQKEGRHGSERRQTFTLWGGMDSPSWWEYTCLGFVPNPRALGLIALHDFLLVISLFAFQFRNHYYLPPISLVALERTLQVLFREDRKSMSGDCFSVLVILILHRFDLALYASLMVVYLYSMFLLFFIKKKK
jgi:hypothetical protein